MQLKQRGHSDVAKGLSQSSIHFCSVTSVTLKFRLKVDYTIDFVGCDL